MESITGREVRTLSRCDTRLTRILMFMLILTLLAPVCGVTTAQAAANGMVRVKLTRLGTNASVTLTADCDCVLEGQASINISSGTQIRVEASDGALSVTSDGVRVLCGSSARILRCDTDGSFKFTSPSMANRFRGDLTFTAAASTVEAVLSIYIEDYLCGVVGWEMSDSSALEALKAQTVAARNYVLKKKSARSGKSYDVTDTTSDQVFKGTNAGQTRVKEAVTATEGYALYAGNALVSCYYSDSNGGQTESTKNVWGSKLSYSVVKDDPYDLENPKSSVKTATIRHDASGLNDALRDALEAGTDGAKILSIDEIEPRDAKYDSPSRLYRTLRFTLSVNENGDTKTVQVDVPTYGGMEDWYNLSINSGDNETVYVDSDDSAFYVRFRRSGHGVGMSQRGAQRMAADYDMTYRQILEFYYPGAELRKLSLTNTTAASALSVQDGTTATADGETAVYDGASAAQACAYLSENTRYTVLGAQGSRVKIGVRGMVGWIEDGDSQAATPTPAVTATPTATSAVIFLPTEAPAATPEADTDGDIWMPDDDTDIDDGDWLDDGEELLDEQGGDIWMPDESTKIGDGEDDDDTVSLPEVTPRADADDEDVWMPDDNMLTDDGDSDAWMPDENTAVEEDDDDGAEMKTVSGTKYVYVSVSAGSTLTLRETPSTSGAFITALARGTKLQLLAYDDEWTLVRTSSGQQGYAARAYLSVSAPEATTAPQADTAESLFDDNGSIYPDMAKTGGDIVICNRAARTRRTTVLYRKNSASSTALAEIPSGAHVTVTAYNDSWAYVTYGGKSGFVLLKDLKAA